MDHRPVPECASSGIAGYVGLCIWWGFGRSGGSHRADALAESGPDCTSGDDSTEIRGVHSDFTQVGSITITDCGAAYAATFSPATVCGRTVNFPPCDSA
ncbi:hypothetical protein D3C74_363570 [compost metagenome]